MADNDNRYRLWQTISKEYDLPDYNQFSKDMEDATKRKSLHDAVSAEYDLPDFDQFSKDMGYGQQTTQQTTPQGNQNTQNGKKPQQTTQSSQVEEGRGVLGDNGYNKQKIAHEKEASQAWNNLAHQGGIKWTIEGHPEVKMVAVTDDLVKRFPQLEQSRGYQVPFNMSTGTPIMQNIDDKGNIITPDEASEQYTKILTNQDFDYVPKQETAAVQIGSVVNTALSTKGGWLDRAVQKAMEENYGKDWKDRKYESDGKEISASEIYAKAKQGIYDNINGVLGDIRKSLLFSTDEQRRQTVDELYQKGYLKEDFLPKANALHYISNVDKGEQVEELRQRRLKLQVQREVIMDKLNQIPPPDHAENMAEFYARRANDGSELYASDLRKIDKQIAQYDAVIDELEGRNNLKSEWGHAVQTSGITDIGAWDFGITDLKDAMMMYPLAKKMQNGDTITQDDYISLKLLSQANEADAVENAVMPSSYNMFKGSLQSVPSAVQFLAGGEFAKGATAVIDKAATRTVKGAILKAGGKKALKAAEKVAEKAADSKILKFCGMLGKDFRQAFVMENTTGAATTGAEILNRHIGTVTESDDGFKMEGESLPTAIIKGEMSQNIELQTEFLGEHFPSSLKFIRGMAHTKVGSAMGLRNLAAWLTKVSRTEFATTLKSYATRAGINGVFGEYLEEVAGTAENALLVGDQKFSDLLDVKQQEEVAGSVVLSCLGMGIFGTAIYTGQRGLNMPSYYRLQHLQNKWDNAGLDLFTGEEWAKWKDRIDNTPNEGMKFVMADILRGQNMTEEQMRAAYNYASCTLTLRGMNIGAMKAAQLGLTDDRSIDKDNAYVAGKQAKDEEKHDIQIEFEDRSHELAEKLGITEQQLDNMSDDELESLTGKDDQLDNLIYDYQTSHAKYQGVVDNADDEIDKAAQEAARQTDMATDKSRGTVRNATIKATKGEEDYGVYIVSGNVATNEDGSINVGESDDMILYYDPKTGKIEHCDALRFAALGEEVNAEETRNQAIADAKEKAIRKQAGIIDGTVGEGTTFTITDAQGVEHTYEVLAENGDGSAMITLDGNVQEAPVSLQDLQNLKDAEEVKRLEAAKMQRQQYEEEREKQNAPVEDNLDYADIINTDGEVEIADVVDEEGNPMFPDAEEVFFVQNQGNRAKVMVLDKEGNLKPKLVDKSAVQPLGTMSVDEYKQERQKTLKEAENESEPSLVDETETSNNVVPTDNTTTNETQPGNEAGLTTPNETQNEGDLNASNEQESTSKITLEDGTEVPMLEDGNPDFSQLTAGQVAELYDTQFGEDAGQIITNNVDRSKKALDKANAMKVSGGSFVEQKASKEAKDKAIAEAQAKYDSAKAIEDAYNERMLAKEEDTPEGRRNLIEKARRKFNRMKSSVKDNAQAIAQLYNETVGSLLHRLYDSTGIDVFDDTANTVDEYVASSIAPYSLNYEGTETSKGVKQETGLSRADFAKTGFLAKEGKGKTIDQLSNDLWRDRPENLQNVTDQDVRNAIIDLITSGQTAFGLKNHIQNLRIAEAENILEQQKRQADELAHAEKQKEEESQSTGMADNNAEDTSNADVTPADEQAEDNLSDMPFEAPSPDEDAPFSAKDKAKDPLEVWNNMTDEEKAAYIEQNRVKDTRLVDDVVGKKLRKAIEKIAGMMGANIQWQRTDMIRNGWFNPTTKTIYLALDSSILEGVQFVFGHEMTHDIKKESPAMYDELKGLVKEKYGEELFKAMTDDNEQRYADAGKRGYDRSYYEEETVADAIGKMINDLNLTRSIALKMSHPLLAKIHDVLLKVKNALMATQYSDDVKGIIRTIEMAYVKTANGTFESSASEGTNDEQFSVRDANERFNNEIENFKNKSHKGLLHLGTPSPILKACGVDVDEITLSPKVLNRKLNQHSLTTEDVKDLVNAIQKPIMVYKHGEEAPNIVVITNADIRGNKLSLSLELDADGNVTKLNNVSSIHDKDAETEINRWLSWDEGYLEKALRWVDKEKVSDWLSSARLNSYSQTENNQKLSSIAKILNDFENPNISEENISNDDENVLYSLRQKPEPEKKGIGYKVFVLGKDGKLYPPMVANPNGAATPVGVWLDADAAPIAGESKTGRPQVKQGGKGTQGGSGKLAYRPGWHLGVIPYAIQFNRKDAEGNKTLFPKNFVFAEVEYAADKDYQDEAHAEGINGNGNYQHSLAGLKHLPTDGYYMYRTNPNPETDPWVITGAMKVNRLLTRAEQADIVRKAGREPQKIQEGDIVTDDVVNSINQEIAAAPKFSLKVYHGSGADFTEFDFDHMGEGAGSQAFGWGGYVTSSKKIGKNYADVLRHKPTYFYNGEKMSADNFHDIMLNDIGYRNENMLNDFIFNLERYGVTKAKDILKKGDLVYYKDLFRQSLGETREYAKDKINAAQTLLALKGLRLQKHKGSLYEVNIPDDNGSNYLEWEEKPSDEVATKIIEGLYGLDAKTLDDMASKDIVFRTLLYDYIKNADKGQMIPLLVKTHALTRGTTYDNGNAEDDIRFVYTRLSNWMGSPKAASKFLSSIGFTGIKYPAGTIMGGAEEGDTNYVVFKPEDMQIVEHEKFSVKKMIFDPREISDTEKQRRGDMLIHATPVDVAKDQIIKTENLSARKVAEQWWRKNIGSPLYYETEIGKVEINENSIQSSLAHRYGQAKLDAITSLKDGFNNAVYLGTIPDFVRTRDNVQNHYFAYPINYDGKRCYVFCRAMEDANKNSLYVHEVFVADNIQKEGNTLQTAAFKPHGGIALYKHILSDVLSAANVANSSETSKGNAGKFSLRLQDAINETDTEPTEAQKKSGNYKKGHVKFGGYDYTIENPKGSYRSGVDENGKDWKQKMNDTYGYIRGKFGKDGDHLDMFINDNADLDNWNGDVFVVDQVNPDGKFDEHKVMYGYDSLEEAKKAYLSNYEKGWTGLGNITPVSKADFDKWLDKSNRKLKPFADYADITSKTDMDTAPSSFEEFLDAVRYSIRNEKERAAAEDAYNFAQENRPDRYSRYAIVNMEKPGAVPQYLEKKTAADSWRRYYNKLKWGNYKLFDLDKPFEDNVKNLVGKFPETFRKKNDTTLSKINELTVDYNKRKEEYDAMSNSIQELLNGLMKQGRSLAEAESVIRDWGLYKEMDSKYQNLMGIRKQLNELRSGKVADGERYSLIGKKGAANLDHEEEVSTRLGNLNVARQMENTKKDAKAIKMATGWERGADGKWRYEIPDAKLSDMTDIDGKGTMVKRNTEDMLWTSGKLGDKVDAPSLFKAYPDLKDVRLETDAITNGLPSNGSFNPKINTITIHANNLKYLNSILNHEIQHAIQHIEGFARGGNPEYLQWRIEAAKKEWRARVWADALRDKAEEMGEHHNQVEVEKALMDEYKEMGMDNDEWMPDKETRIKGFNYFARGYADRSFDNDIRAFRLNESTRSDYNSYVEYTKLGGEVEARNVQSRMNMSPEERRKILAEETEDVARKDQIFLYGDNDAYSLKQNKDAEYLEAVKNGDMEKAQKMVYDAARAAGYVNGTDYQGEGSWNAPSASVEKKDFANLDALRESVEEYSGDTNVFGIINGVTTNDDDFYYNPGRVGFRDAAASETSSVLRRLRYDKADANTKVKVYRTVPADVKGNKLMSGDWIALSKQYCIEHGNGRYGEGGYRIIEEEVPIKTIWNDGNDMREFGFDDGNNNEAEKNVPNNRKLLDAVTYDNNGNVIPLSERFNESNDDIRYSLKNKDRKQAQLDIILKTNPMLDDYHTGIRKVEDIKTLEESVGEARSEAEKYGDEEWSAYPDITNDMLQNALETGEITIYSSKPIKNGVFVTPSYMQASDYAGGGNVYEKTVPLTDVAWINTDEGQYAKVDGERMPYQDSIEADKMSLKGIAEGKVESLSELSERLKEMKTSDEVDNAIINAVDAMPEGWRQANKKTINIARAIAEDRKAEMNGEDPKFSLKKIGGSLIKGGTYFSGGGLVEEGLKGIIDPVIAVEYDEKISGVYRNNFGNHIVTADVRDVDPKELVDKIDGDVEYFHASPVCKNYSLAKNNHEELELDKETAASTAEFISKVRPKVVTIENVKGYKDSEAMKTITDALDEAGYKWDANVYNAADYGGYTNRERLIVRAVLDGELPPVPKTQKRKSGWYEAIEDIIPTLTEKKNGVASWMDERLKADGIDWRHIDKPLYVMGSGYANGTVPHAFSDELLPTLRTKSGDVIVMPDGKVYRAMGRVLARVSGVSDDYQMPASEALSHTIIGNGIPTQLTENVIAPLVRDVLHPAVEERASLKDVNEEEKYSLRVDRYRDDLNQWKKDNNLPKDAERPQLPVREPNESAADFLKRVKEYRKQAALWATAPTYEDHLLTSDTAQGQFNLEMQRKAVLTRIVVQDSMLAIRKAQEAIMKEHGVDKLNSAEDAYTAENRSHGKAKNEFEEYNDEFLQPLRKAYNELMLRLGKSYDNVKVYMIAKHGLERNAHIAFKYALDEDFETNEERMDAYNNYKSDMDRLNNDADFEAGRIDFATWKQRDGNIRTKYAPSYFKFRFDENGKTMDYSGLSALFDADDYEGAAADLVKDVEDANPYFTDELWYATNDATKKILRDSYNAGMMTEDNFNFVSGMYRNYIPLRGWGDTNADQVWNYVGGGKGAFSQVVKEAKGRKSLADDPIAYIENMAESAILMNNRNWVKQHLLLLAQNHRTSLLHVSKAWYIKTKDAQGNEEWIPASPQITEGMTSRQVELALEAFEQKMEQMKQNGVATQKREHLEISYPQTNGEEREHEVRVMKGGEEYVIYVNGDPQLAQAVNNTRARKVREGLESSLSAKVIARTGRYMAAAYTSMSPLFIPSNYMRDLTMTLASTAIREDARYNYLLRRNMLRHWNTFPMVLSYQNGTLREKVRNGSASEVEKMFYDFMMNGGETGFVTSVDVEDLKKKFRKDLKDLNRMAANPKKVGHIIMDSIETLNRAIEDSNRFMVYMTSIQYGRSIEEAVNNAKDVTLNFNRKGTGEHWMQNIRNLYLFINPAIQSLQTLGALAKHHRFKFTAVTTGWLATGLLAPMLNNLLMSFFGGDDDKDKYWQFTKWDRRNSFIMWIPFTNEFVKIPLAQEFRGFYGVGDMIASKLWGGEKAEESWSDYAVDLMGQIVDMLPLDPTGYDGDVLIALMPNVFRPIFELGDNVDFTGKPIFKNSEYNKYDPNFTKAYVGTPDWLVRISKMVNSIDNKYPDVEQNAIDRFGDPRFNLNNPAVVDHVLSSYLGGSYTMGSQILGVATKALNGDDIKMADIPLASKFVSNPDDRPVSKKQGEEFWDMKERHDRAANTLSKLKQKAKADGDYSTLDIFFGSDEYRQYKEDDKKVKKYEEDRKKEKAQETGVEYRQHKTTADDVYKSHTTPKDDFEDMKMKQLYEKLNSYKIRYEAIDGISSEKGDAYYKANKAAIDAIEEIAYDKSMISTIKKGFLSDGQDSYDADGMKDIREMRKRILDVLEKANKTMMNNRK